MVTSCGRALELQGGLLWRGHEGHTNRAAVAGIYVECAGRRRDIPPPIAYMPELTRCTHEVSEAVSRAACQVKGCVGAYTMRVVLCALNAEAGHY